jgi:hypothetical protein
VRGKFEKCAPPQCQIHMKNKHSNLRTSSQCWNGEGLAVWPLVHWIHLLAEDILSQDVPFLHGLLSFVCFANGLQTRYKHLVPLHCDSLHVHVLFPLRARKFLYCTLYRRCIRYSLVQQKWVCSTVGWGECGRLLLLGMVVRVRC